MKSIAPKIVMGYNETTSRLAAATLQMVLSPNLVLPPSFITADILDDNSFSEISADGYICSFQKSGRTWLRFALGSYLVALNSLHFELTLQNVYNVVPNLDPPRAGTGPDSFLFSDDRHVPLLLCSQKPYSDNPFGDKPVVFIYRNPFDVLVSFYFYKARQEKTYTGSLESFIRGNVEALIQYLNSWSEALDDDSIYCTSYEFMKSDMLTVLEEVVLHLGLPLDRKALLRAIGDSRFDRMLDCELRYGVRGFDYDRADPDARRVRRGIVGGYTNYLDRALIEYVFESMATRLHTTIASLYHEYLESALQGLSRRAA